MKKKLRLSLTILLVFFIGFIVISFINKQNVNTIYPSVVHLKCKNDKTTTVGSGIIYNIKEGKQYIVTNYHIVKGYSKIYAYDENLNFEKATIVNYDEDEDIAILSITNNLNTKKAVFDLNSKLNKNDGVYILTSFIGNNNIYIIKDGTISSIDEKLEINNRKINVIKLSYDVENGDSGSPVINKKGKVIGMVFLKDKDLLHYGYALPINFILDKIKKLEVNENKINLGAMITNSTNSELIEEYSIKEVKKEGVVILSLINKYPLYNAGLKKGDVIVSFNNTKVNNVSTLQKEIEGLKKNDIVDIEYYRNNDLIKTKISLNK